MLGEGLEYLPRTIPKTVAVVRMQQGPFQPANHDLLYQLLVTLAHGDRTVFAEIDHIDLAAEGVLMTVQRANAELGPLQRQDGRFDYSATDTDGAGWLV
jgi:hypothetical protein